MTHRGERPPEIVLCGYFGEGNIGDEAILLAFTRWAAEEMPGAGLTAISTHPKSTARDFNIDAVGQTAFFRIFKAIKRSDLVVFPGGGILQDSTSLRSVLYYYALASLARGLRRKVYFLNQGVGPLGRPVSRKLVARLATKIASVFSVRDPDSAELLKELGVDAKKIILSADTTLLLASGATPREAGRPSDAGVFTVGFALRPHATLSAFLSTVPDIVESLPRGRKRYLLFEFQRETDEDASALLIRNLDVEGAEIERVSLLNGAGGSSPDVMRAIMEMGRCGLVVGMRLHSLIFAAIAGAPFVGLSYDPKVKAFCGLMGRPCLAPEGEAAAAIRERISETVSRAGAAAAEKLKGHARRLDEIMERFAAAARKCAGPDILGAPVSTAGFEEVMDEISRSIRERGDLHIVTLNPEIVMKAAANSSYMDVLRRADFVTADGVGIRIAALAKYGVRLEKTAGIDIVERLLSESRASGTRIFLLGSKPETLEKLVEQLAARPDAPIIAGSHHGYFDRSDSTPVIEKIREARPDVLLVGMGAPIQEEWIARHRKELDSPVMIGVGGCFDVLSGALPRAPVFFQRAGLEWFHRLVTQPTRARRMAALPVFLAKALFEALRHRVGI